MALGSEKDAVESFVQLLSKLEPLERIFWLLTVVFLVLNYCLKEQDIDGWPWPAMVASIAWISIGGLVVIQATIKFGIAIYRSSKGVIVTLDQRSKDEEPIKPTIDPENKLDQ